MFIPGGNLTKLEQTLRHNFEPPPPRPQPQPVAGAPIDLEALAGMVVGQLQPQLNALQAAITAATNASLQAFQAQLLGQLQQVIGGQQPQQDGVSTLFQVDLFP